MHCAFMDSIIPSAAQTADGILITYPHFGKYISAGRRHNILVSTIVSMWSIEIFCVVSPISSRPFDKSNAFDFCIVY